MAVSREHKILHGLSKASRVLEIGASFNPLVPKRKGWTSWTVDHATRAELVEKYTSDSSVDVSKIEEVDFVWADGALDSAVPTEMHGTFDACVSSHAIEHIPDFVGFFVSLSKLLTPDGIVAMAVPDKRFCFDYFRPVSSTGRILEAHLNGATRHAFAARFDQLVYGCKNGEIIAWGQTPVGKMSLVTPSLAEARGLLSSLPSREYVDCHAWQFTPASFELIILELQALGVIDFHVARSFPSAGCEFIVRLKKAVGNIATEVDREAQRMALLERSVEELGEQADYLRARGGLGRPLARRWQAYCRLRFMAVLLI
jgi:SAM-dependent methyltransferase